jgi:uncharacterized protein (TIGR00290 family)
MAKGKAILSWSCGKDSALSLYDVREVGEVEVVALLTTLTQDYDRSCMHGIRRELLERQAEAVGIRVEEVFLSGRASNGEYEARMAEVLGRYREEGVSAVVFGDIFLEDLRRYREEKLAQAGLKAVFPLWGIETRKLACRFLELGFKARVTCVDSQFLGREFTGRLYDESFLDLLPPKVDPCGENGEFHTFAYDGPIFGHEIAHRLGEVVLRDERFFFCDLIAA